MDSIKEARLWQLGNWLLQEDSGSSHVTRKSRLAKKLKTTPGLRTFTTLHNCRILTIWRVYGIFLSKGSVGVSLTY